jgi:hypothetical protein
MRFAPDQLRDKALAAVEEAAERARSGPIERTKALGFALAYLWAYAGGERAPFIWLWRALALSNDIARSQNVSAALNGILRALDSDRAG